MSNVYTKKLNKNISLTDRRQKLIKNSLFYIANIENTASRITEGENRHFKTNTDHHNGDFNLWFFFFGCCKFYSFEIVNF